MKGFLIKITIFLIGFIVFILLPIGFISQYDNIDKKTSQNHNIISLQTKSLYDSLDILLIGNSYCYSSIDTEYLDSLGISSFNLGIATAGVQFYDLLLNDYFENIQSPPKKLLVLVTPMTFSSKSDNYSAYPIHRYLENELSNLDIVAKYNTTDELISMYKKSIEKALQNIISGLSESNNKQKFNHKGFYPSNEVVDANTILRTEHLYLPLKKDVFDKSKVEDLLQTTNYYKRQGIDIIFFELPTHLLSEYFSENYLSEYKKTLKEISNNFELICINQNIFSSDNFRNIDHMNTSGAKIATKELVKLLE